MEFLLNKFQSILKNFSILLVEDDYMVSNNIKYVLEDSVEKVFIATNIDEALKIYDTQKTDILIVDIVMKDKLNGLDFIEYIRTKDSKISIFILSGYSKDDYLLRALKLNLDDFILKPITFKKIESMLNKVINKFISSENIHIGSNLFYSPIQKSIFSKNETIILTNIEAHLIELLIQNRDGVLTYNQIENSISIKNEINKNAIKSHISRLRKKLNGITIVNYHNIGYKLIS